MDYGITELGNNGKYGKLNTMSPRFSSKRPVCNATSDWTMSKICDGIVIT